jgi:aminobenzoyl-glutamate utilization protein B
MGEKSMDVAAKVIAATAVDLLVDQKLIKLAWDEFNERMKGKLYSSLIPEKCDPPIELNADVMSKYR